MKKSFFLLGIMFLGLQNMSAQESVYFGVKGGINISTFKGDGFGDFNNPDPLTSFNLGLLAEIPVSDKFSVQPEVLYSGQGFDLESKSNARDAEYQLDYINIPVLAKYYLTDGLSLEAGPQVGFLVNSEIDTNPRGDGGDVPLNEDQFNKVDLSLALGASYKFRGGFFVNARYNFGLSDVYDDSFSNFFSNSDVKHSVLQGGIGFMF